MFQGTDDTSLTWLYVSFMFHFPTLSYDFTQSVHEVFC
jgi:hypothetical protein